VGTKQGFFAEENSQNDFLKKKIHKMSEKFAKFYENFIIG
jgi:hypothetical protein